MFHPPPQTHRTYRLSCVRRAEPDPVLPHRQLDNQAGGDRLPLAADGRADRQHAAPALLLRRLRQDQTDGGALQDGTAGRAHPPLALSPT